MGCGCKKNKGEVKANKQQQLNKEEREKRTKLIREKLIRLSQKKQQLIPLYCIYRV